MVSLAAVWASVEVPVAAVVGHSQGEIAAAVVAGGLSLHDGARVVALRSRALRALSGLGGMVSVQASLEQVSALLGDQLHIASLNADRAIVVSGHTTALHQLLQYCETQGIHARQIPVDYPSHSPHVETLYHQLLHELAPLQPHSGTIPFYSTLTTT